MFGIAIGLYFQPVHLYSDFSLSCQKPASRVALSPAPPSLTISLVMTAPPASAHDQQVILGLVQMACSDRPGVNLDKAVAAIQAATRQGAQIICLQELFGSRYFCQSEDVERFALAEPIPGPTTERLSQLAAAHQVVLIVPVFEKRAAGIFHNTAVVIDADGTLLGQYRKMHIPDDPLYYEKFYFTPGDLGFRTFHTRYARIGVLICWDRGFPEGARLTRAEWSPNPVLYRALSATIRTTGQRSIRPNVKPGKSCSAATRSPTACTSPRSPRRPEGALNFWGITSFVSDPFWPHPQAGEQRQRGNPDYSVCARPAQHHAPVLAVFPRPPD